MFFKLFILFIIVPIMDLWLLIKVGGMIGVFPTVMIVILTGVTGAWLAKMEGISVLTKIQASAAHGRMPGVEMINGVLVFVGGVMLLTPGFITDIIGLLMIFPVTRTIFASLLISYFKNKVNEGAVHFVYQGNATDSKKRIEDENVIDADFEEKDQSS